MPNLVITIPTKSIWPSAEELAARSQVENELRSAKIGHCTGAGGGRGEMDLSFNVDDEFAARAAVDRAMQRIMPEVDFRVRVTT